VCYIVLISEGNFIRTACTGRGKNVKNIKSIFSDKRKVQEVMNKMQMFSLEIFVRTKVIANVK